MAALTLTSQRTAPGAALILIGLMLTSLGVAQDVSDEASIRDARSRYNEAILRQDVDGIVSFFDEDYQVTTSLGELLQGRDGEAAAWQGLFDSRRELNYVRQTETVEVSRRYPLAAETGEWVGTWMTDDGAVRTGGHFTAMWRKVDGVWKVRSELFVALYCEGLSCP